MRREMVELVAFHHKAGIAQEQAALATATALMNHIIHENLFDEVSMEKESDLCTKALALSKTALHRSPIVPKTPEVSVILKELEEALGRVKEGINADPDRIIETATSYKANIDAAKLHYQLVDLYRNT